MNKRILVVLVLSLVCVSLFGEPQAPTGTDWANWSEEEKAMFIYGFQVGILACLKVIEGEGQFITNVLGRVSRYEIDPEILVKIIDYYYDLTRGYQQEVKVVLYNLEDWLDEEIFHRFEEEYKVKE